MILENVTGFAIWGSLAATAVLGCFLAVQAVVDPDRRARYAVFSAAFAGLAALDFARSLGAIAPAPYEIGRLLWGGVYAGSLLALLGARRRTALATAVALSGLGLAVFLGGARDAATTVTISLAYGVAAVAHGRHYARGRGYASAMLTAYSAILALMCALYYAALATGNPKVLILGYAHYAEASIVAVLIGWTHLPRELRGKAPVRMAPREAALLLAAVAGLEVVVQAALFRTSVPVYLGGQGLQLAVTLAFWFRHRHQLVIHADNVAQLLEERTAELRAALEAKGEVIERQRRLELAARTAGQVAHDMQNLVAPLLGRLGDGEVRRQAVQILELNAQLLALSRRGRTELQPVCLSDLAREVVARFPGVTAESTADAWVSGSHAQLARALSNLVANAVESDPDRPVPVAVRTGRAGNEAFLEVSDRGPGIPEAIRGRIFEPFFSSKDGRQRSGTGLGLTIVAAVVDDHRGEIDLETSPQGTRFRLRFPAIDPPVEDLSCSATVLVVDDDKSARDDAEKALPTFGWTVIPASNGDEALRVLQAQAVDVMLLDHRMPGRDGLETFFGALHLRPGLRAVVHSGHVPEEQAVKLRALGVSAIL
ncbi:MAG TPA: hybrid sensor histidine kinase/response regulator, partial [Planctomycetota bacterium]|nr:hybrid sensor histidine kinase/response regulator [Planctomycetota bacterium]